MKFTCEKNLLNETINSVALAVASKSTIPALEGIYIKCSNKSLILTGYNLELGIIKTVDVNVIEEGEVIINASLLSNIISKMPDSTVQLSSDKNLLTKIICDDASFTIMGLSCDEYPEIPNIDEDLGISLNAFTLKEIIHQTLFAVSQTDQNPVYTGVLFDVEGSELNIVAVDGYRMAMRTEKIAAASKESFNFIVPGKTLSEIQKLLSKFGNDEDENEEELSVNIKISNKHIMFSIKGYVIISRLLEGEFLDYKNAFPKDAATIIDVSVREFINSINRASIKINDRAKSPIKCLFKDGTVNLSCETTLGKVKDSFTANITGDDIFIGFNNKYMLDALRYSERERVMIRINRHDSPITIVDENDDNFKFLVLPVRIAENNKTEE